MNLSIVIPVYNEADAIIQDCGMKVWSARKVPGFEWNEVIFVDDGSTDDTAEHITNLARQYRDGAVRLLSLSHRGKAGAIIAGIRAAQGDYVLFSDYDKAVPMNYSQNLLDAIQHDGADIAIGSRGFKRAGAPAWRYILSLGQVVMRRVLLGLPFKDTQCGFKAFRREVALDVIDHLKIYGQQTSTTGANVAAGFDVEFLLVAQRLGYKIAEIPVEWRYQKTRRVKMWRDAWRGVLGMIGIWAAMISGQYPKRESKNGVRLPVRDIIILALIIWFGLARSEPFILLLAAGCVIWTVIRYAMAVKGAGHGA